MNFRVSSATRVNELLAQAEKFMLGEGISRRESYELLTIVSELVYNIVKFTPGGTLSIEVQAGFVRIEAQDSGSGFAEIMEQAMIDGYSTAGSLGLGVPSLIRMCDDLQIDTSDIGTLISCEKKRAS